MLWHDVILQMHCSGLAWHPDVATQMVLASEDDRLPVIQMWDLRFASSPLRVLESHTRYERSRKGFLLWGLLVGTRLHIKNAFPLKKNDILDLFYAVQEGASKK